MPPAAATVLYLSFIAWLYWRDIRAERNVTRALWIPVIWLAICSTRYISQWLAIFGLNLGGVSVEEGSPLDAVVFLLLILAGLHILRKRRVRLSEVMRNNRYLALFLGFCFLSILWSDYPFVALKRLLKDLGHPIMVLIVLTEPDPEEAIVRLSKRCAYLAVPLSILFIKYFPALGRDYSEWTGGVSYGGVTFNKNTLGLDCFIFGAVFFWYFLKVWRMEKGRQRRNELVVLIFFLGLIGWLFRLAQSTTSTVSFLILVALLLFLSPRWVNPRYITFYFLVAIVMGIVAEGVFGIYTNVLHLLGKDPTLTDRTIVWKDLLAVGTNPFIGVGFESFWLGDRPEPLWAKWHWHPTEAHNGYLETYLDLGIIGLALFLGLFVACYRRARRNLVEDPHWGRFCMGFLIAVIFYNWTEVPFRATNPLWFYFFLVMMQYPVRQTVPTEQTTDIEWSAEGSDGKVIEPEVIALVRHPAA